MSTCVTSNRMALVTWLMVIWLLLGSGGGRLSVSCGVDQTASGWGDTDDGLVETLILS